MLPYLIGLIQNDQDLEKRQELADRMSSFLTEMLEVHFLYEYKANPKNPEPMKQAMGCFYVYWSVLSHLLEKPREGGCFNYLDEENRNEFIFFLRLMERFENEYFFNLRYVDLVDVDLLRANLKGFNFRNSNLKNAVLKDTSLRHADLGNASLQNVDIKRTDLIDANLENANLKSADIRSADLRYANLKDADLTGARLNGTTLLRANLKGSNLSYANLDSTYRLNYPQLAQTKTLYGCTGIPKHIEQKLRETHPHLFEEPKEEG